MHLLSHKLLVKCQRLGQISCRKRKLRTILEGPLDPTEENPSDATVNARNIFAELELASELSEKGIVIRGFDDLQFDFHSVSISIECKRLHSIQRVPDNVATATRQLQGQLQGDHARGLIVLVVDRLLGLDRLMLHASADSDVRAAADEALTQFIEQHRVAFSPPVDTRIVGLAFIMRFQVLSLPRQVVGRSSTLLFSPLSEGLSLSIATSLCSKIWWGIYRPGSDPVHGLMGHNRQLCLPKEISELWQRQSGVWSNLARGRSRPWSPCVGLR